MKEEILIKNEMLAESQKALTEEHNKCKTENDYADLEDEQFEQG